MFHESKFFKCAACGIHAMRGLHTRSTLFPIHDATTRERARGIEASLLEWNKTSLFYRPADDPAAL